MLETVGQFKLQYSDQAQRALGSLVAMPSLLSRVFESQGQEAKISSIRDWVQVTKARPSTQMVVSGIGGRVVVPQLTDLREEILREFHCS